jgi:hypothetical protein
LLYEPVGDEVLAEQRGSDIRAGLPSVLAELALRRRGKHERRTCTDHEPTAEQGTRRGNAKNGVAEPGRSSTLTVLIELGQELTTVTTGRT